ncbi:hypothetical protein ACFX1X_015548 [Malus domestica]
MALWRSARRATWLMSFGFLNLTRAKLATKRNEEAVSLMGCWNAGHAGFLPARMLDEVKRIKANALARLIAVMELTMNDGGKKRSSPPTQEIPVDND